MKTVVVRNIKRTDADLAGLVTRTARDRKHEAPGTRVVQRRLLLVREPAQAERQHGIGVHVRRQGGERKIVVALRNQAAEIRAVVGNRGGLLCSGNS